MGEAHRAFAGPAFLKRAGIPQLAEAAFAQHPPRSALLPVVEKHIAVSASPHCSIGIDRIGERRPLGHRGGDPGRTEAGDHPPADLPMTQFPEALRARFRADLLADRGPGGQPVAAFQEDSRQGVEGDPAEKSVRKTFVLRPILVVAQAASRFCG